MVGGDSNMGKEDFWRAKGSTGRRSDYWGDFNDGVADGDGNDEMIKN